MGVFPDLEDKICRISSSTIELIGIDPGDYICIESPDGIVRSVKAFPINEDVSDKKEEQKEKYPEVYKQCKSELNLNNLRKTDVDIPEIYLDEELRSDLGLLSESNNGVCHPVRVYRDSVGVISKSAYEISIPIALVFITAALDPGISVLVTYSLLGVALLVIGVRFVIRHRNHLVEPTDFVYFLGIRRHTCPFRRVAVMSGGHQRSLSKERIQNIQAKLVAE